MCERLLVESLDITHVLPCLADSTKIRFHAAPSANLGPALPYLNAVLPRAVYHHAAQALTLTEDYRIICIHAGLITGARADDVDDGRRLLQWLADLINDVWARRHEITPCYERRERLGALDTYKLLPKTNCRQCGVPTCLAFAVELAAERQSVLRCAALFDAPFGEQRRLLITLLSDAGYEVPSPFLDR